MPEPTPRETLALGYLSAELANRADAWHGNAPPWFPEPPEWLDLWRHALDATALELELVTPGEGPPAPATETSGTAALSVREGV